MSKKAEAILTKYIGEPKEGSEVVWDEIAHAMEEYGKARKKAGARSFARLVKEMRDSQKAYFRNAGNPIGKKKLAESKKLESQVDRACEAVLG